MAHSLTSLRGMPDLKPRGPNIRVPPAFFVGGFLIGLWLEVAVERIRLAGGTASERPLEIAGWVLTALGAFVAHWGVFTFWRARTTMLPFKPASNLVRHGPYRFTRNPMYVGLTIMYVGIALLMNAGWPLVLLPLVVVCIYWFVIREEEKYLAGLFGEEYLEYKRRVRRWI
jgi:protein-S-isoprenylcysteine O-methyltransferase Ste14